MEIGREGCSEASTHLVCGDLGRRVDQGGQEGQGGPVAPHIQYQGGPEVQEVLVAQQYCLPWDPRQCKRTFLEQSTQRCCSLMFHSSPAAWSTHRQPRVALGPWRPW